MYGGAYCYMFPAVHTVCSSLSIVTWCVCTTTRVPLLLLWMVERHFATVAETS